MKPKRAKIHNEEWFAEKERLISEPIQNTVKYYRKPYIVSIVVFLAILVCTYDYYGTVKSFATLNEWFMSLPLAFSILLSVLIFAVFNGGRALALVLTVKRMQAQEEYKKSEIWYHVLSLPWFGLLHLATTTDFAVWAIVNAVIYIAQLITYHYLRGYFKAGIECRYCIAKYDEQRQDYLGKARSVTFIGAPGSGKTVFGGTVSISLAEQRWAKLQFDYFTERARWDYYLQTGNAEKLKRLQALEESYCFYKEREDTNIPCFVTSIGIQDLIGRYSYVLTSEVYAQLKRVPEYSVLFNDESGRDQGCDKSKKLSESVKDFYRLNRHFGDFILINTEQGGDGNAKDIRKCTDYNLRCYWQEWILAPKKAQMKFEKHKEKFYERREQGELTEEEEKYLLQELYYEAKYIATIGFRKIKVRKEGTPEQGSLQSEDDYKIIPSRTVYNYDERAYSELYECRDEPLELGQWTTLTLNSLAEGDKTDVITAQD